MGREIRRVPPNWDHPTGFRRAISAKPDYLPMFDRTHEDAVKEWKRARMWWRISKALPSICGPLYRWMVKQPRGKWFDKIRMNVVCSISDLRFEREEMTFEEWHGEYPDRDYYRPKWEKGEATWYQVYETVSEGCPVTPPFETKEGLIQYLMKHGDFWDQRRRTDGVSSMPCAPWTEEQARKFVDSEWAPTMIGIGSKIVSGQQGLVEIDKEKQAG